jgi:hypothetical protein
MPAIQPCYWPDKQSEATQFGSECRSVLELFPSGRPHRRHNHKSLNQPDNLRSRHPDASVVSPIAHTDRANLPRNGSEQFTAARDSKITKLEIRKSCFKRCEAVAPTATRKSAKSAKTPITNEPASTPFQALMNGIWLAMVNVQGSHNFRFGGEAMPMSFSIERLDSEMIAIVWTCVNGCNRMCEHDQGTDRNGIHQDLSRPFRIDTSWSRRSHVSCSLRAKN